LTALRRLFMCFAGLIFCSLCALAQEAPEAPDELTVKLANLRRQSQVLIDQGKNDEALKLLEEAQKLASDAKRPEAGQFEAIIARVKAQSAAKPAVPEIVLDPTPGAKPNEPAGILLSLDECIEIGVQNNLGLRINRITDRESDFDLRTAYAHYYPTFDVDFQHSGSQVNGAHSNSTSLTESVTQNSPVGTKLTAFNTQSEGHPGDSSSRGSQWGVSLTQPLWKGRSLDVGLHDIRAARLTKLISRGNLELSVQDLIFTIKQAYANCQRNLQTRAVDLAAVDSAKEFLRQTRAREKAGQVTRLDVFNAEVQLADRELDLTTNEHTLGTSFDNLKQIMDIDLDENVVVNNENVDFGETPNKGEVKTIEIDENTGIAKLITRKDGKEVASTVMFQATRFDEKVMLDEALAHRIDLLNSARNMAVRELDALLAKDGLGHQIDLTAGYSRTGTGAQYSDTLHLQDHDYTLGVKYSIPLGKVTDRVAYEKGLLELQKAEIALKRARTQVQLDVRENLRALKELEKNTLISARKVEQAKQRLDAARISFERGLKDSFDLITSQQDLLTAKTDFINRRLDYIVQLAQIEQTVGKPTGRVDLSAKRPGGVIDATIPDTLKNVPKSAPMADPELKREKREAPEPAAQPAPAKDEK